MNSSTSPINWAQQCSVAIVCLLALVLTACAAPAEGGPEPQGNVSDPARAEQTTPTTSDEQPAAPSPSEGKGSLVLPDESFVFEIEFCVIDETDIGVHGPGQSEASGERAYLGVSFVRETSLTSGDARVDLGATTQFESTDDIYVFTTHYLPGEYSFMFEDDSFVLEAEFRNTDGQIVGPGTLTVDCR